MFLLFGCVSVFWSVKFITPTRECLARCFGEGPRYADGEEIFTGENFFHRVKGGLLRSIWPVSLPQHFTVLPREYSGYLRVRKSFFRLYSVGLHGSSTLCFFGMHLRHRVPVSGS